jgi:hypothetical protein
VGDGFQSRRIAGACKRGERCLVVVGRGDAHLFREPQRERADAGEQIGRPFFRSGGGANIEDQSRQFRFAFGGGLQEGRGRQQHGR